MLAGLLFLAFAQCGSFTEPFEEALECDMAGSKGRASHEDQVGSTSGVAERLARIC